MNYLSVCSGIEAITVAWEPLGFKPIGFSEIEPFPSAVLKHHYPNVQNFGDMTQFQGWNINATIDILAGGTPCQSFSVAGLRKGLADPRGNLMLTFLGIAQRQRPRWIVWENVPGVLSSNRGRDFGTFLGALGDLGYGWSYRVLDAQWFGVAQRRRRVFVVGHLGDATRAAAVLFESESVRRNTPPSREAGQRVAATAAGSAGKRGKECLNGEGSFMRTSANHANVAGNSIASNAKNITPIVNAQGQRKTSLNTELKKESYTQDSEAIKEIKKDISHDYQLNRLVAFGEYKNDVTASSLKARDYKDATDLVLEDQGGSVINVRTDGTVGTLRRETHGHEPAVIVHGTQDPCVSNLAFSQGRNNGGENVLVQPFKETSDCLTSAYGTKWNGNASAENGSLFAMNGMAVRRLTPVECERLQGFPDGYTNIPWRKKPEAPDGPRYKSLGNSMAVPVVKWIGKRIKTFGNIE